MFFYSHHALSLRKTFVFLYFICTFLCFLSAADLTRPAPATFQRDEKWARSSIFIYDRNPTVHKDRGPSPSRRRIPTKIKVQMSRRDARRVPAPSSPSTTPTPTPSSRINPQPSSPLPSPDDRRTRRKLYHYFNNIICTLHYYIYLLFINNIYIYIICIVIIRARARVIFRRAFIIAPFETVL